MSTIDDIRGLKVKLNLDVISVQNMRGQVQRTWLRELFREDGPDIESCEG